MARTRQGRGPPLIGTILEDRDEGWALAPVIDWLFQEGRFLADSNELVRLLGLRLVEAGAPVIRIRVMMRTLHPLQTGWSASWDIEGGLERDNMAPYGLEQQPSYIGSPFEYVARTRQAFRRRLEEGLTPSDHSILHEFASRGGTDYVLLPTPLVSGQLSVLALVTDRAGGFTPADLRKMESLAMALSPILDAVASRRLAHTVATTYLGPHSGARVLEGRIRRGDAEVIRAAIWFSDLRDWSRIANERPASEAIDLANSYFEIVDGAISEAGGEVLKLIGDAVLAIFPVGGDAQAPCRAAITAAEAAQQRAQGSRKPLAFGVGLHLGEIVYGNVGSPSRLDFTVMGQAVNLTARIEKLSRSLDHPIILSAPLALASGLSCVDLGCHPIAGWEEAVQVFGPPQGPAGPPLAR